MKRIPFYLLVLLVFVTSPLISGEISSRQAAQAARNFLYERINQHQKVALENLQVQSTIPVYRSGLPVYYVVNFQNAGFALVSGIDCVTPILGYSFEDHYDVGNLPCQLPGWMQQYEDEILYHSLNGTRAAENIQAEWQRLLTENPDELIIFKGKDVSPFTPSNWDQGKFYNELCPSASTGMGGHVPVGCVATALAQVMYFYRYPEQGIGSNTYTHPVYGQLSADFGNTSYLWESMLNQLNNSNFGVALLSYHCGIAMNMNYAPEGSGTSTAATAHALKSHFGYQDSTRSVMRMALSSQGWLNLLHQNLDLKRPVLYGGMPGGGGDGHCWVTDGYQGADYFHMNWGWSGSSNGYYTVNNLAPTGSGTNFNLLQEVVVSIYPGSNYPSWCQGLKIITESTTGTITDGSGKELYQNNSDCSWLIAPEDSVKSLTISFQQFNTETINDVVNIYAGTTTSDPLMGSFSGTSLPAPVTITGNRALITFVTNNDIQGEGWYLTYTATYPKYCANQSLTALTGTFSDGSQGKKYQPNTICTWLIQPPDAASVVLSFSQFDTEPVHDYLNIYDLGTEELLATFSGHSIPPPLMSLTGGMYIEFRTNGVYQYQGWTAEYWSLGAGIAETSDLSDMVVYPNPASGRLNLRFSTFLAQNIHLQIVSTEGKVMLDEQKDHFSGEFSQKYNLVSWSPGVYVIRLQGEKNSIIRKLVINP